MSLHDVCAVQSIWDRICWFGSGAGVHCLSLVDRQVRRATLATPAFICLAGRDEDGFLVPWRDPTNVLACTTHLVGWSCQHFRVRADTSPALTAGDRERMAVFAVKCWLREHNGFAATPHQFHCDHCEVDACKAAARPSSACSDYIDSECFDLSDYGQAVLAAHGSISPPVAFPPQAHKRAAAQLARRIKYGCCYFIASTPAASDTHSTSSELSDE